MKKLCKKGCCLVDEPDSPSYLVTKKLITCEQSKTKKKVKMVNYWFFIQQKILYVNCLFFFFFLKKKV